MRLATLPLLAVAVFASSLAARGAMIDQNYNGLSDVWEMVFHATGLDPNADTDGDGFTNAQEAAAGTDPRDPASHPPTVAATVSGASITLTWATVAGKQYRVQTSPTLGAGAVWTFIGSPYYGTGNALGAVFGITAGQSQYFRVQVNDVDSDNDGVNDWEELQLGYDPFRADTFNTGFGDRQTILNAFAATDTVAVAATHATASTVYGDTGVLSFTRTGNLDAVTVAYTVGGTAVAGTDYAPLAGTVTFPVGVNTVTVNVTPMPNASFTTSRTVVVTLATSANYQPDPNGTAATVTFNPQVAATGQIVAESWDNLTGGYDLSIVPFDTAAPTRRTILTSLETATNTGIDFYGSRIRGYITAPTTGTYTFWTAADDILEFRLSTDDQMANLVLRAYNESWVPSRVWNTYATQQSAGIALVAGQRYAFECKFWQGYGGDNLAIGWLKPGQSGTVPSEVVPGSVLSPYAAPYNPPGLTTLYFGALSPLAGAPAAATGFASVRLSADNATGIVSISRSGLSGTPTSLALRGPTATGSIIAEFAAATPQTDGSYLWAINNAATTTALKAGQVYASVGTAAHPTGEMAGQLLRSSATGTFTPPAAPPALPTTAPTAGDAARLMTQATFGANTAGLAAIQSNGYAAWIDAQLNAPVTLTEPFMDAYATSGQSISANTFQEAWWKNAITAPDQLRQRVAFALSEIFVVSDVDGNLAGNPTGLASYYDVLLRDAFGNYRTLLEDVTLHPVMGDYLNMLGNSKADPTTGIVPNENYGRESIQLFSVGLKKLNPDGSLLLDSNSLPIATYGQDEVKGYSAVYTGWNYAQNGGQQWDYLSPNYRQPMGLVAAHHDQNAKRALDSVVLPAGQSGAQDLKDALDMLSNHPSAGPFFCRQLIQKLVTSNPSAGYVYRVAQVFANNGQGVRGDLRAVVRAILLDYEARSSTMFSNAQYGKQREPVIRLANLYRAFNGHASNGHFQINEYDTTPNYGQAVLDSPSVFNFFSPTYTLTGEIATAGLVCPEFGITTATTVIYSSNDLRGRAAQSVSSVYPSQIGVDLSALQALSSSPAAMVDSLNALLLNGQMSAGLRTQAINAVTGVAAANTLGRAQTAVQILCTSPEFCIQK